MVITINQLINHIHNTEVRYETELKGAVPIDMIEWKKIFSYKTLEKDINEIFKDKDVTIKCDEDAYSIYVNQNFRPEKNTETKQKHYININIESDSFECIHISLEDSNASKRTTKNFYIYSNAENHKGEEDFKRVERSIYQYLKSRENLWSGKENLSEDIKKD